MTEDERRTFAAQLASLRDNKGLTQYALAARSGVSRATIARCELGTSIPNHSTVLLLAEALGTTPGAVTLGGEE